MHKNSWNLSGRKMQTRRPLAYSEKKNQESGMEWKTGSERRKKTFGRKKSIFRDSGIFQ